MRAISAFVIAGTHSGVGKTTVSLGVMAALRHRGLKVQPFKIGPDFIDPGLHAKICRVPSYNLDGWMLRKDYNRRTFWKNARDKDVAVVEGMMGLYDGRSGAGDEASTAEMAKWLGLPVILVLDAAALARSAAAMILGYRHFDAQLRLIGVIFNRVTGTGHLQYLRDALKSLPDLTCFGGIPVEEKVLIPERHLGLTVAQEGWLDKSFVSQLVQLVEKHVDLDRLLASARIKVIAPAKPPREPTSLVKIPIAVASDPAFCFYYPDNLDLLKDAGAKVTTFSPIRDRGLPKGTQGIYLGGGYPELYARQLSRNRSMRAAIKDFIEAGGPVYAECGGFMYLTAMLTDSAQRNHPMVGTFPFKTRMLPRLQAFGYCEVTTKNAFAAPGEIVRGQEFHYSEIGGAVGAKAIDAVYVLNGPNRKKITEGYRYKNCLGSYVHLHFGSNPAFAQGFVAACRSRGPERRS
jgi:cobyrinic acid a,c-diamide synthase